MGLAALIVTIGAVVSLMVLVVVMHSDDVFLICLNADLVDGERYVYF